MKNWFRKIIGYGFYTRLLYFVAFKVCHTEAKDDKLVEACKIGDLEQVKKLIKRFADIHFLCDLSILMAAYYGHLEVVKYLYPYYSKETQKVVRDSLKTHPKYYVFLREVLV